MFPTELPLLTPNCSSNELIRIIPEKIRQEQYSSKINLKLYKPLIVRDKQKVSYNFCHILPKYLYA